MIKKGDFMKKLLTSIIGITMLVFTIVSTSGCSFIKNSGNMQDLPNSSTASEEVIINTQYGESYKEEERKELSMVDAVDMVKNSALVVYTETSSASAVLIDVDDGIDGNDNIVYMLTCHHVIEGGGIINVVIPDQNYRYNNHSNYTLYY